MKNIKQELRALLFTNFHSGDIQTLNKQGIADLIILRTYIGRKTRDVEKSILCVEIRLQSASQSSKEKNRDK